MKKLQVKHRERTRQSKQMDWLHSLRRCEPDQVLRVRLSGSTDPRPEQWVIVAASCTPKEVEGTGALL